MTFAALKEVEPARAAEGETPSASPAWIASGKAGEALPHHEGVETLTDLFRRSVKEFGDKPCLGKRTNDGPFVYETYTEIGAKVDKIGSALAANGVKPKDAVGVIGPNAPEWMMIMQGCNHQNAICVPLYDTLGANAVEFILKHSGATAAFAEASKMKVLAEALPSVKGQVKFVGYWGQASEDVKKTITDLGMTLKSFDELLAEGAATPAEPIKASPEDLCTIMYTSGTTGDPKGVLIKHSNVLAEISAAKTFCTNVAGEVYGPGDCFLSYLPLAHIFDRAVEEFFLEIGGCIAYWRGDIKGLVEDIAAAKPTMFAGVPRVFDRIYGGIQTKMKAAGWLKNALFNFAFDRKKHFMEKGLPHDKASPFFDGLVFKKLKEALGGRVRIIISGAAPLSAHVEQFLKVCMMTKVCQGYGLTETMAGSCIALPDSLGANVGPPLAGVKIRLESVPDMNYDAQANPPRGEILIGGNTVYSGYYKREDLTKEVLEPSGWFHTGDIGEITPEGYLKIIDRKKNIFKLAQGEYVAVEKVEATFKKFDMLEQIWVYGNSFESSLVAVCVPVESKLMAWAKAHKVEGDFKAVCADAKTKAMFVEELTKYGKEDGLKGFELVRAVHVESEPFDVEKDLLTPTFKMKRPQLLKYYQKDIDALYAAMKK